LAIKSGRSISQEAELRIERSFLDDRLAAIEEHFKGWRIGLDKLNQWVEQVFGPDGLFGPDSRPTQSREWSPAAKALDEDFLHEEKRRDEQRRQIREAAKALHEDFLREKKRRRKT
jgi:hypothetical protein